MNTIIWYKKKSMKLTANPKNLLELHAAIRKHFELQANMILQLEDNNSNAIVASVESLPSEILVTAGLFLFAFLKKNGF